MLFFYDNTDSEVEFDAGNTDFDTDYGPNNGKESGTEKSITMHVDLNLHLCN